MQVASMYFKERAHAKLHDAQLQASLRKFQGKFVPARRHRDRRARRFRGHAHAARGDPPARARRPRRLAHDLRRERARARRDGALRADAGRDQRAGARDRPAPRRAQDHQVEVDGVGGVGARSRDRGRGHDGRRDRSRRIHPADQQLRAAVAHHRPGAAQVARRGGRSLPRAARHAAARRDRRAVPRGARACCARIT